LVLFTGLVLTFTELLYQKMQIESNLLTFFVRT